MVSKDEIKKIKGSLRKNDQKDIAELAKLSTVTVNKFFNEIEVSEDSAFKILEATEKVLATREKRNAKLSKKINSITKIL